MLRVQGERAERKVAHWQAVAVAASEQCGRATVPRIEPVRSLAQWLGTLGRMPRATTGALCSACATAVPLRDALGRAAPPASACFLSGPEGGLSAGEEELSMATGFVPVGLGPRILRADTAPLAALAWIALSSDGASDLRG